MPTVGGTVTEQGVAVEGRVVRVHNRITGDLLDETTTGASGTYTLDTGSVVLSEVLVIALPTQEELAVPSYNAAVVAVG